MKIQPLLLLALLALAGSCVSPNAPRNATQVVYLSGHGSSDAVRWNFYCNDGRKAGVWTTIPVPSCWEQEGFGSYNYGYEIRGAGAETAPGFARESGKYYYDFTVPAAWKDKTIRIVFEGSMTDTTVVINGKSAGPTHQGSFYRFKYDITPLLKFGEKNRLEVTVDKESANASVNNAERRGDYWNFGGIFRPVYLEALPTQFIDWTAIDAKADGSFSAQVHLGAAAATPMAVMAQILDNQGRHIGAPFAADIAVGQDTATLHANESGVKLWTAETPNLYHVLFTLLAGSAAQHDVEEKFGFRTFEVRANDGLYLNGQKIVLKGVDRHSFWPETGRTLNVQICFDDVRLMKEANMNAVRMSHYPPDHEFLEACDELGLYVLDELGGWHGSYNTPTGQQLIGEMVRRDVNHPSIIFWDNGNEGGWNAANDGEFAKWDPQQRAVIHPQARLGAINSPHYPTYQSVQQLAAGKEVFMFTEFLHGLYDGGGAVGLHDYWELLHRTPNFGGGFIWALLDEAVARTDENGKLDARGNLAPDGIVGPHREKEGSFFAVRQIWSPVQVGNFTVKDATATVQVENAYDFINLNQCTFTWEVAKFPNPNASAVTGQTGHEVLAAGEFAGPNVAPHATTMMSVPAKVDAANAEVLYLTAKDPMGQSLWTWSFPLAGLKQAALTGSVQTQPAPNLAKAGYQESATQIIVSSGTLEVRFSKETGLLAAVMRNGKSIALANGPRFLAYHHARGTGAGVGGGSPATIFQDVAGASTLAGITAHGDKDAVVVEVNYNGPLKAVTWRIEDSGAVRLDYTYAFDGLVDLIGVNFDYPEAQTKAITWEGVGPYRVWQNRMDGGKLDVWHNEYNDTIPGETWIYPEFKGYFQGWHWAVLDTTEGKITINNLSASPSFLGIFSPRDANVGPLLDLPKTGISFLDVVPSMRDKGKQQEQLGPQGETKTVAGEKTGRLEFEFSGK